MNEEELEFYVQHSTARSRHGALQEVVTLLLDEAGHAFTSRREEAARVVRDLAEKVEELRVASEKELSFYVAEADRRRRAKRRLP